MTTSAVTTYPTQKKTVSDDDYTAWKEYIQCGSWAGPQTTHPMAFAEWFSRRHPNSEPVDELFG
jgi:hypothetical protein